MPWIAMDHMATFFSGKWWLQRISRYHFFQSKHGSSHLMFGLLNWDSCLLLLKAGLCRHLQRSGSGFWTKNGRFDCGMNHTSVEKASCPNPQSIYTSEVIWKYVIIQYILIWVHTRSMTYLVSKKYTYVYIYIHNLGWCQMLDKVKRYNFAQ